ncbi:CASP8 associated protein 2 [Desmophyllum pertusum]|uniref:CASP8 associated protein 2 n=1 Tax=Desmophyllum pertusum TaxID=174260 RepID=A0A9X0A6Y2_9CNID|nr:CASP8 associated protein 2 [Desmophyllum pertusum]
MEGNEGCVEETETVVGNENSSFIRKDEDSLDVDLYEDLSVDLNQEMTYPELKKLYEESQQKIKELEAESQKLKDENFVLKKNISSLYLTAREEIKRKDAQIRTLQDKEVRSRKFMAKSQQ